MKSLEIRRFWQATLWSIANEKRNLVNHFVGNFIFYVIAMTTSMGLFSRYSDGLNIFQCATAGSISIAAWVVMGGWYTAEIFRNLRTKNDRAQFFLLPATNCEKYCSRLLFSLGKGLILSTAALIAADLVQMLTSFCFCGDAMSVSNNIFQSIMDVDSFKAFLTNASGDTVPPTLSFLGTLWLVSVYILGGTYLRKVPAVLTTLILFFGSLALSFLLLGISWLLFGEGEHEVDFWWDTQMTLTWVITFFTITFTVLNMWLSYRKFCRMQII